MTEPNEKSDSRSIRARIWGMPGRMALIGLVGIFVVPPLMKLVEDGLFDASDTDATVLIGQVLYFILWLLLLVMFVLVACGTILWIVRLVRK